MLSNEGYSQKDLTIFKRKNKNVIKLQKRLKK